MKALLMHRDHDLDLQQPLPWNEQALVQDLELGVLFAAMAAGDAFLLDVVRRVVLSGLRNDLDSILYRQEILKDCLRNPAAIRKLYDLAVEALDEQRKHLFFGVLGNHPSSILYGAIEQLEVHVGYLKQLRGFARSSAARFESLGLTALFAMLERELSDEYLATIQRKLGELKLREGVLVSAELGGCNEGANYVLRRSDARQSWLDRMVSGLREMLPGSPSAHVVRIAERDEAGGRALSELRDRGIATVANALAQSSEHIQSFFRMLRTELAFYVGCLNIHDVLSGRGCPVCFPTPGLAGGRMHHFEGLRDASLALSMDNKIVANGLDLDGKSLVVITGANQGGKSSFLRSVGLAQLMMQGGMFVPAESFGAELCRCLGTLYKREEDSTMKSGKLDEELARMSDVADALVPHSMLLFNEAFAATNEREGSEIAKQVVSALLEKGVKVFFVTHLYEFAHGFFDKKMQDATFLRAERKPDGTRTFRLVEGEPLETSFGEDLYRVVFGAEADVSAVGTERRQPGADGAGVSAMSAELHEASRRVAVGIGSPRTQRERGEDDSSSGMGRGSGSDE